MRTTFKIALASVLVFTLAAAAPGLNAQTRRSTTTTTTSSSSDNKSTATASRSAGSTATTATGNATTATRSTATNANRQSTSTSTTNRQSTTSNTTSTTTRQSSTANRNTATPSSSTSTQVRRGNNGNNTGNTTGNASNAQVNRGNGSTTTNNGNNSGTTAARRSTGSTDNQSTTTRRQTTTGTARTGNAASEAAATETPSRRATTTARSGNATTTTPSTQETTPVRTVRSNANATSSRGLTSAPEASAAVTASGTTRGSQNVNRGAAPNVNYTAGNDERGNIRMDKDRNLNRVPPRERGFTTHDRPGFFYGTDPHYFGYRVQSLPPRYRRVSYWGRDYYYYNNVYYLRYGNVYVISRPPFGIALDIAIRDAAFASVRFSYSHNVYRTFDIVDRNYRTILEQNREIARNNELLARQNSALALNSSRALSAYEIASALGLIQSFANINTEYFYQDGVFYVINKKNRYEVIVPPAGALVSELPDDYDTIVLNGVEYYKVDDTVYRLVLVDGIPALEVLGQMYGSMATKYNYYY